MKFSLEPKVLDGEKLHLILWTFVKFRDINCSIFVYFQWPEIFLKLKNSNITDPYYEEIKVL